MDTRVADVTSFDPKWVEGVRKWVKATFTPPRFSSLGEVTEYLRKLLKKDLEKFTEYLFYTKGLLPREKDGAESIIDRLREKIAGELKAAREMLDDAYDRFQYQRNSITPGTHEYRMDGGLNENFYRTKYPDMTPEEAVLKYYVSYVAAEVVKVRELLSGKVLRAVSSFLSAYAGGTPFELEDILLEYQIGKMKLVYEGTPSTSPNDPRGLSGYLPSFQKARELLERRGFGKLWYGLTWVSCPTCGGENPHGKQLGVGAHYVLAKDWIVLYDRPSAGIADLMIHELGHRYYFRFMSAGERARFDSFFGEVMATSSYGSKATEEDFAEVFRSYVLGEDLSRDQIERFREFLAGEDRRRLAARVAERYLSAERS